MPLFSKAVKFNEADAENIVTKSLNQIKGLLEKEGNDVFVTTSGKGVVTLDFVKKSIKELMAGEGEY